MKIKLLISTIGILTVGAIAVWFYALSSDNTVSESEATIDSKAQNSTTSDDPYATLMGDAFDEAYIADMLAHHEGAVNMAEQAQAATDREEIRSLAVNITATQSREIVEMRQWQQEWGYEVTNSAGHNSHSGGGADMSGDMVEMQNSLLGLIGEAFDKEFLKQMIVHHEQAIEMSKYAGQNAKHQEIKDVASDVIDAQATEIEQMKQWQKKWGY